MFLLAEADDERGISEWQVRKIKGEKRGRKNVCCCVLCFMVDSTGLGCI